MKNWTWKNVSLPRELGEKLGRKFELELFTKFLDHEPDNVEILMEAGNLCTQLGRVQEGLTIDEKLVRARPEEPIFHYNLACSRSLLGQVELALKSLGCAIELGYRNLEHIERDADLANVRKDPRYQILVRKILSLENRPTAQS